jgi:hypothetical protein
MDVINLDDRRPYISWFALCLECKHRWIASVLIKTSIFKLECPECGAQNSFASVIPENLIQEI